VFWGIFTAIGMLLVLGLDLLPGKFSREAEIVDEAYILLMALAVPVFAMVASVLLVAVLRFRSTSDEPTEDGPPVHTNKTLVRGWLVVTSALALMVTINPGFIGLAELRGESSADLVVNVTAQRWSFRVEYENGAVSTRELVLPVDQRVRFDITALDIVHSFWVPAFRTKIDAVPGRVTELYVTPDREGSFDEVPGLRVQCAEICGLGHARMAMPVRVVSEEEFDAWVADLAEGA
jgi:cytochrome c oxidase subunit 2